MKKQIAASSISEEEKNKYRKSIDDTLLWLENNNQADLNTIKKKKQELKDQLVNLSIF